MGSKCDEFHILFSAGKTPTCPFSLSVGCCEVKMMTMVMMMEILMVYTYGVVGRLSVS